MNPFDLRGPEFLGFYFVFGTALLVAAWIARGPLGQRGIPKGHWLPGYYPRGDEAYAIALLRGGSSEVAAALLGRLVASGYYEVRGLRLEERSPDDPQPLTPLEEQARRALLGGVAVHRAKSSLELKISPQLRAVRETLQDQGALPTGEEVRSAWRFCLGVIAVVCGTGAIKLLVAVARGRTNIEHLLLMMLFYAVVGFFLLRPQRLTAAGRSYLVWLEDSHRGLIAQFDGGRRTSGTEAALLAAIYGMAVVPALQPIQRAEQSARSSGGSFNSGSSCSGGHLGGGDSGGGDSGGGDSGGGDSGGGDGGGGDGGGGDGGGGGCGGCGGS